MDEDVPNSLRRSDFGGVGESAAVGVALIRAGDVELRLSPGAEPVTDRTPFEIGSLGKTMTSLVLADLCLTGALSLDNTVADFLGVDAGAAASVTLEQLATHSSGLPRLPPSLFEMPDFDESDPYALYGADELFEDLRRLRLGEAGYSNLGYQLLGHVLSSVAEQTLDGLIADRVFRPLDMLDSGLTGSSEPSLPGYDDGVRVGRWHSPLPGDGGWECSLRDLARYARAHVDDQPGPLTEAIQFTLQHNSVGPVYQGLGWGKSAGVFMHDGGTGGFTAFMAFDPVARTAAVIVTNWADAEVDTPGLSLLRDTADPAPWAHAISTW